MARVTDQTAPYRHIAAAGCTLGRRAPEECCCVAYDPIPDSDRTPCEIWSRVMGYHRPVSAFNAGKQQEHRDRKPFIEARHES